MSPFKLSLVGSHSSHGMVEFGDEFLKGGENVILQKIRGREKREIERGWFAKVPSLTHLSFLLLDPLSISHLPLSCALSLSRSFSK